MNEATERVRQVWDDQANSWYAQREALLAASRPVHEWLVRSVDPKPADQRRSMEIKRADSRPSGHGPADWFTGSVRIDPLLDAPEPARVLSASVTFEPGARTAWHTHPLGQTLIVTSGVGRAQRAGGPVEELRPGDVVWFPPGEKHWHGASPTTAMTHVAIQEKHNGTAVEWMEHVTDEQYSGRGDTAR